MRTLQGYLTRQVLAALMMTVAVFTGVLLLGSVIKEVLMLLVNGQASLWTVAQAVGLLIPFVLVFALPMGLLTATLLTFGRFSADQELTAVRASGVSLLALVSPILLLSLLMSCVCAVINLEVAPRCRAAYKQMVEQAPLSYLGAFLQEKTFMKGFKDRIVYAGRIENNTLHDVLIYFLRDEKVESYVRAEQCVFELDPAGRRVSIVFSNAWRVGMIDGRRVPGYGDQWQPEDIIVSRQPATKISDMTYRQLWRELRELNQRLIHAPALPRGSSAELRVHQRELEQNRAELTSPLRVQIHRRVAFSFACIAFTLVGIPLGIRSHRRETTFGIALALLLVMVYYSFFILGSALDLRPEYSPHLLLWLPNFIFQAAGAVFLWRANRGL